MAEIKWQPEQTLAEAQADKIEQVKREAYRLLQPTDWMIVRQSEIGEEVPSDVLEYRQAVRDATDVAEAEVMQLESVDDVRAYQVQWPEAITCGI